MEQLDRLQDEAERLVLLLKDRQPGLSMWWTLVKQRLQAIEVILDEMQRSAA